VEPPPAEESAEPIDPHDRRLILACLRLTPTERLLRLEQAHEFRVLIRDAQPYELRER
jgi:hypothetical protein